MTTGLLTSLKETVLELLFPLKCAVCEKETSNKRKNKLICTDCLKNLAPSASFFCPNCEAKTADGALCFSCLPIISNSRPKFYIDRLIHPFSYKDPAIQKIIKAFKYKFIKDLDGPIGKLMAGYLEKIKNQIEFEEFVAVPVPLHKRKFNFRGYNQTELIAAEISKTLKLEMVSDCLIKNRTTKDQAALKENRRLGNLKDAFVCAKPWLVCGKKVLLIDDVYTTGATMTECAKVLKEAGAKEIVSLVIARG